MSPNGERLLNDLPAAKAPLACEMRRYFNNPYPSLFRFEYEDILEGGPTCVSDALSQTVVLQHVANPQVFDCDEGIAINVMPGRLVRVVLALTGDLEVLTGRLLRCFAAAARTLLAACGLALRPPELLVPFPKTARVLDRVAIGVRDEVRESDIQPDRRAVLFLPRLTEITDDEDIPVPVGAVNEMSGFGSPFQRTMLLDLEAATEFLWDVKPLCFGVEEHISAGAVLPKLDGVPAVSRLEARKANRWYAKLFTTKEPLEGFVEPMGKSLYRGLRDVFSTSPLEAVREIVATEELPSLIVMSLDLIKHLVVKMAAFRQRRKEQAMLLPVRKKTILERFHHAPIVADMVTPGAAIRPPDKAGGPLAVFW